MEEEIKPFQKIPGRVKYYLLEWKDTHMQEYILRYGKISLNNMSLEQIQSLYAYVYKKDSELLSII